MKRLHTPVHMLSLIYQDAASNSDPAKVFWPKRHARVTLEPLRHGFLASHTFRTLPRLRDLQMCKLSMSRCVLLKHKESKRKCITNKIKITRYSFEKLTCSKVKSKCPKFSTNFIPHDTLHLY